ncbi:LEA14-like dessication related protein [Ectothiorhodospira mobilis]|uniref:LEA14-like dessication related protein n=1 Tax=Ectothiorhodospira mobilis TaxID=195064 RepID=A0A1I4QQ78_ECTMO|nr:LEA type 2 family protein [Ectothiorhodospira mobilis]SFM42242.1 LEA14-like dessication related protein [Ectothiorhodospira mobilis]
MTPSRRAFLAAAAALILSGCAALQTTLEQPSVSLESVRVIPGQGMAPRFAFGLRVVNPNPVSLPLKGMSYTMDLEGHRLLNGVARDLETVPAYGESRFEVEAGVDLLGGLKLFNDLLRQTRGDTLDYTVRARLDAGGLGRVLTVEDRGELPLSDLRGR